MPAVPPPFDPETCRAEIAQSLLPLRWQRQTVRLFDDRVEFEAHGPWTRERRFYMVDAVPERCNRQKGFSWIALAGGLGALALGILLLRTARSEAEGLVWGLILTIGGAFALLYVPLSYRDVFVFFYRQLPQGPEQPYLYLHAARPSREAVEDFLGKLRVARERFVERCGAPAASGLPTEAEQLRKFGELHERGILTDEEFARVKARILGASRGRTGFAPRREGPQDAGSEGGAPA